MDVCSNRVRLQYMCLSEHQLVKPMRAPSYMRFGEYKPVESILCAVYTRDRVNTPTENILASFIHAVL